MFNVRNRKVVPGSDAVPKSGVLSDIDLQILWISRTLSNIDFHYEPEFIRLKQNPLHEDLKKLMRDALVSTYHKKRAPYVKLLVELRRRQRQTLAAEG